MIPFDFTGQQVLFLFEKQKIVHEIRNEGVYTDENQKNWKMVAVIGDLGVHKRFFPHKL